jgi:putative aldouronate transport system substrate-binding protein
VSSNATDGYYSETWAGRSGALARDLYEKINEIVVGRQPLGFFDQVVREWRDGGGEQARGEFQQEIAAARG